MRFPRVDASLIRVPLAVPLAMSALAVPIASLGACEATQSTVEKIQRSLPPKPIEQLRDEGDFHYRWGRIDEATVRYAEIIERAPGDWRAQYKYALCMEQKGELQKALAALEVARAVRPRDADVAFALADVRFELGDQAGAFNALRARAEDNRDADSWLKIADLAMRIDDYDTAIEALTNAVAVDEQRRVEPYKQAATILSDLGRDDEAVRRLRQAHGIAPRDEEVREALRSYGLVPGPTLALPPGA